MKKKVPQRTLCATVDTLEKINRVLEDYMCSSSSTPNDTSKTNEPITSTKMMNKTFIKMKIIVIVKEERELNTKYFNQLIREYYTTRY